MFFLVAFAWLVAASFGFLLAILSPAWVQTSAKLANRTFDARIGIFHICEFVDGNATYQTHRCVSLNNFKVFDNISSTLSDLALACAAIAIGCASLSVIAVWCSGIFFHMRRRTKHTQCFLMTFSLFILLIFLASAAVWIIVISATTYFTSPINSSMFNWPMWLAVGASGGYLMAFFFMLFSFCAVCCGRRKKTDKNIYRQDNHHF